VEGFCKYPKVNFFLKEGVWEVYEEKVHGGIRVLRKLIAMIKIEQR